MKNWKTALFGLILALPQIISPIAEKRAPTFTEIAVVAGALGLGNSAKDKDVTGAGDASRRVESK
jgi:hypothetical protein